MGNVLNRRDILKLTVAAGVTLATGGITDISEAVGRDKSPDNKPEHAKDRFLKSMNCSQAIFETYAPSMGMSVKQARKLAAAFAGGMGMGSECGAVTAAFMVIGMKYGKTVDKDTQADGETFKRTAALVKEFKARHEHIACSALLESDMSTPVGVQLAAEKGYFVSRCPAYVKTVAEILDKMLV